MIRRIHAHIPVILACGMLLPSSSPAQAPPPGGGRETWPGFGRFSLALNGGFQYWTLSGLEESLSDRNASYEPLGFAFQDPSYGIGYSFGTEIQYRFSRNWFAEAGADWTRLSFDDRDRQSVAFLGGSDRPAVSISYTARVESRPLVFSLGLGRAFHTRTVRFGLVAQGIIAPLKLVDEFNVFIDEEHDTEIESTGVGYGGGGSLTMDYLPDTNMTLFVDLFFRMGAADVELETPPWESSNAPGTRRVDFTGGGLRLGVRWI